MQNMQKETKYRHLNQSREAMSRVTTTCFTTSQSRGLHFFRDHCSHGNVFTVEGVFSKINSLVIVLGRPPRPLDFDLIKSCQNRIQ